MHLLNNPEFSLECEHFSLGSIKVSLKWGDNLRGWVIKWRVRRFQDFKGGFLKSGVLKKEKILPQCDNVLNRVRLAFKSIAKSKLTIFYWPRVLTVKLIRNLSILCKIDEFNKLLWVKHPRKSYYHWIHALRSMQKACPDETLENVINQSELTFAFVEFNSEVTCWTSVSSFASLQSHAFWAALNSSTVFIRLSDSRFSASSSSSRVT